MRYNPNIHNRKSLRLKNYDYSIEWLYFITISVKDKLCLFGNLKDWKNALFESWKMINHYWLELENKYNQIKLHEYIIMPNHFHWIIQVEPSVGANLCVCPDYPNYSNHSNPHVCPDELQNDSNNLCTNNPMSADNLGWTHKNSGWTHRFTPTGGKFVYDKNSICSVIQWFKTMTTNKYIKMVHNWLAEPFYKKLWQKNYYEHIIRNEESYLKISDYIRNNPIKWKEDTFYNSSI